MHRLSEPKNIFTLTHCSLESTLQTECPLKLLMSAQNIATYDQQTQHQQIKSYSRIFENTQHWLPPLPLMTLNSPLSAKSLTIAPGNYSGSDIHHLQPKEKKNNQAPTNQTKPKTRPQHTHSVHFVKIISTEVLLFPFKNKGN